MDTVYPHEFAANTAAAHPQAGVGTIVVMSHRMTTPPLRARYGMDDVAGILSPRLMEME